MIQETSPTIPNALNWACDRYGERECIGFRKVLGISSSTATTAADGTIRKVAVSKKDAFDFIDSCLFHYQLGHFLLKSNLQA